MLLQGTVDDLHVALAVAEDDRVLEIVGAPNDAPQGRALLFGRSAGWHERLGDVLGGRGGLGDLDPHRIVQERIGETSDLGRHGGREEQRLARERHQLADALDVRDEAHVEHPVGFVDDQDLDRVQKQAAAAGEIEQAAGGGDDHVGAARDLGLLVAERDAADQERQVQLVVDAVFVERLFDLGGKLARRLENEGAGHARAGAAPLQHRQHRQSEGGGLAGAGLGDAQDVAAFQGVGNGLFLNRRRRVVARRFDGFEHFLAQAEFAKFHEFSLARMPRIRSFLIWGPRWTASMRSRVPTRKPRAAPEPSFTLGWPPLDQIAKKSNQLGPMRFAEAAAAGWTRGRLMHGLRFGKGPCAGKDLGLRPIEAHEISPCRGRQAGN